MRHKAVLFDLDGTLLDTLEDLANCMNTVLQRFGFPGHETALYKYYVGDGVENLVLRAFPEGRRAGVTMAQGVAAMREEYERRWAESTRPYEGIPELLDSRWNLPSRSLSPTQIGERGRE